MPSPCRWALALLCLARALDAAATEPDVVAAGIEGAAPTLALSAVYTGESWHDVAGGLARGSAYLDNLDLQLKLDGRAWGLPGSTGYLYVLYNNGARFAADHPGALQGITNIEAVPATRLYEAWVETPAGPGSTLRAGLYNVNTEFDSNEVGALFLNPAHGIGTEFGHSGVAGPSIFPVTALALRLRHEAGPWRLQGVVLDGVPGDPADPARTYVHLGGRDGALGVVEAARALGPLHATLGAWHYTTRQPDLAQVDVAGAPIERHGSSGAYALASGSLWSGAAGRDLSGFVRVGLADGHVAAIDRYLGLGVVGTGPLSARPRDRLGLALAVAETGAAYRAAQLAAGAPVDAREVDVELSYRAVLTDWLLVQPDLQYVVNPSTDPTLPDAWVVGIRFQMAWSFER